MLRGGSIWGIVSIEKKQRHQRMHSSRQQHTLHCQQRQYQETIIISQLLARNSSYPANAHTHHGPQSMHLSALHSLRTQHKSICRIAVQHTFGQSNLHATRKLQPAAPQPSATNRRNRRCPHSLYLSSHRPLRSPIRSFHSRYLGGATPVSLAFTRQSDLQGVARCPLSYAPRRMTTVTVQRRDDKFFWFTLQCTSTLAGRILGALGQTASEDPLLLSFLLEILDSALSPSIARPAL